MRYVESESLAEWEQNIEANDFPGELLVEIPLDADSMGFPTFSTPVSADFSFTLTDQPFSLVFTPRGDTLMAAPEENVSAEQWNDTLATRILSWTKELKLKPRRLVVDDRWEMVRKHPEAFQMALDRIGEGLKNVSIGVPFLATLETPQLARADFLAVEYPALVDPKRECMELNSHLSELAQEYGNSKIFIYRANLMGMDKLEKLRNILRFWPEEVKLQGLVFNSQYDRIPPRDATSYFGITKQPELEQFIKTYLKRDALDN